MSRKPYKPIDCTLHDHLESAATLGTVVVIVYDQGGQRIEVEDRLTDVYTKDKEEFLETAGGLRIRLDMLVSVDGVPFR